MHILITGGAGFIGSHLAAAVGVQYILRNPMNTIITNIHGTEAVLDLCNTFKKRLLIVSTSEVYGKQTHIPLVETDNIIYGPSDNFRWTYATSKLMNEFMALACYRTTGLEVTIVRLFNTVGPRQSGKYGMVIPRLVNQALNNRPLTVHGDGSQTRTFTYVKDVVWAIMHLVQKKDAMGQVYNIGGTEEISILDLAQRIIAACNSSSPIRLVPIFDTILVTYSRNHSGRKVSRGGLDHTSHRLVSVGFSEKQAVLILYGVGGFAGLIAVLIGHVTNPWVLTMILPAGVAVFLFGRFLFKQNVYAEK